MRFAKTFFAALALTLVAAASVPAVQDAARSAIITDDYIIIVDTPDVIII